MLAGGGEGRGRGGREHRTHLARRGAGARVCGGGWGRLWTDAPPPHPCLALLSHSPALGLDNPPASTGHIRSLCNRSIGAEAAATAAAAAAAAAARAQGAAGAGAGGGGGAGSGSGSGAVRLSFLLDFVTHRLPFGEPDMATWSVVHSIIQVGGGGRGGWVGEVGVGGYFIADSCM